MDLQRYRSPEVVGSVLVSGKTVWNPGVALYRTKVPLMYNIFVNMQIHLVPWRLFPFTHVEAGSYCKSPYSVRPGAVGGLVSSFSHIQ